MHPKSIKMRSGTLRAASWKQVGSGNCKNGQRQVCAQALFAEKFDFGSHFGSPVDFEGGPKTTFLVIMLEKIGKMKSGSGSGKNMKFGRIFDAKMGGRRKSCF